AEKAVEVVEAETPVARGRLLSFRKFQNVAVRAVQRIAVLIAIGERIKSTGGDIAPTITPTHRTSEKRVVVKMLHTVPLHSARLPTTPRNPRRRHRIPRATRLATLYATRSRRVATDRANETRSGNRGVPIPSQ